MGNIRIFKQSFSGGEIAPEMFGRIDDVKFGNGLRTCRNFVVKPQGAIENRAGFEFVRPVKYEDKRTRLLPFYYTNEQTLVIELGVKYCRFHTLGATVLDNFGQPYEIVTPYAEEDLFDIHYVQSADVLTLVHPKYPPKELRRYSATDWRLIDINFMSPIHAPFNVSVQAIGSGNYDYYYTVTAVDADNISESVQSTEVHVVNNLYASGSKNRITWSAVNGAARYRVYKRQNGLFGYIGTTTDYHFDDDNIDADMSCTPPIHDEIFRTGGINSVAVAQGGSNYITNGSIVRVDILNAGDRVGNVADGVYEVNKPYRIKADGSVMMPVPVYFRFKFESTGGSGADVKVRLVNGVVSQVLISHGGAGYSSASLKIQHTLTTVLPDRDGNISDKKFYDRPGAFNFIISNAPTLILSDPTGYGAVLRPVIRNGVVVAVDVLSKGFNYSNPSVMMNSNVGHGFEAGKIDVNGSDYPGAVSYFQQRRVFAGTLAKPQNIWMTRSGTESNMSYSIPSKDDDRIAVRVAAREASRIVHIVSLTNLMLLTNSAEWKVGTNNSDVLTPSTISVMPYSYVGASNVQPITVNNTMIYAASRGGHMRELAYSWQAGGYITGDISLRSPHLFDDDEIVDLCYAKAPIPIIWAISASGRLLGCTYIPEQEIGGWHQHDTLNGRFLSCVAVAESQTDALYVVVRRNINGQSRQFIERMRNRSFVDLKDAFFVDAGMSYNGTPVTVLSGLNHLEGEMVSILADGAVHPQRQVINGRIQLEAPASCIHVGLPIVADAVTLPVVAQIDSGYGQGRTKNVNKIWLRVHESSGIFAGPDADNLVEAKQRTNEPAGTPPVLKNQDIEVVLPGRWNDSGQVYVRQRDPLPLTIVSITSEVAIGS
jgi:hypothetical protein